jgi:hypothetical protein
MKCNSNILSNERLLYMKFGTLFAYWTNEWIGDYKLYAKKAS